MLAIYDIDSGRLRHSCGLPAELDATSSVRWHGGAVSGYKPGLVKLSAPLPWPTLTHPDDRSAIAAKPPTKTTRGAGVKRRHKRDMRADPLLISKLLHHVVQSLGVDPPELYLLDDRSGPLFEVITLQDGKHHVPALLCRPELLQGKNEREIAFLAAVHVIALRDLGPLEKTARRAGLVICGDLEVAKRLTPANAHADLVALWTSEQHVALRRQMGVNVA